MQKHQARRSKISLVVATCLPIVLLGFLGYSDLSVGSGKAFAQASRNPEELARGHFKLGRDYYSKGLFEEALHEFEKAYEISQRSQLLFNIYLAYRDLNRLKPAADALRRYLASDADDPRREQLEARLRSMEESIRQEEAENKTPSVPAEPAEPPDTEVTEKDEKAPLQQETRPARFETEEQVDSETAGGRFLTVPSIISFSVAGAGAITAIVFGSLALSEKSSLEDECAPDCRTEQVDPVVTFRTLSDVGLGVAVTGAVVGGLLWYFSGESEEHATSKATAVPSLAANGGRFDLSWRF